METWIKSITSYMVFSVFFLQILPSTKYEKYIRVFVGMLFLLVIIQPIMEIFSVNQSFWGHFEENMLMVQANPLDVLQVESLVYENVIASYETQLEQEFLDYAKEQQRDIIDVKVVCERNRESGSWGMVLQVIWYRSKRENHIEPPVILQPGQSQVGEMYIPATYQEFITHWKEKFQITDTVVVTFE